MKTTKTAKRLVDDFSVVWLLLRRCLKVPRKNMMCYLEDLWGMNTSLTSWALFRIIPRADEITKKRD